MIDLHCHLLPIDDGVKDFDESIELIRSAYTLGYRSFVCSSHFKEPIWINKDYEEKFKELKKRLKEEKLDVKIVKGNELYLTKENIQLLREGRVNSINETNFLLVEAIFGMTFFVLKKILEEIKKMGYIPILAHVERYPYIDKDSLIELKKMGIITQVNIRSLRRNEKIYPWIEMGLIDVLGSDTHNRERRNYDFKETFQMIRKKFGEKEIDRLTRENPQRILDGMEILWEGGRKGEKTNRHRKFLSRIFPKLWKRDKLK